MIVLGYVKDYQYTSDGTLTLQVRIPAIHGPYKLSEYKGKTVHNYVRDNDLPFYPSLLLPHLPVEGEVVALSSMNEDTTHFIVIGLTGGSYANGLVNL